MCVIFKVEQALAVFSKQAFVTHDTILSLASTSHSLMKLMSPIVSLLPLPLPLPFLLLLLLIFFCLLF